MSLKRFCYRCGREIAPTHETTRYTITVGKVQDQDTTPPPRGRTSTDIILDDEDFCRACWIDAIFPALSAKGGAS